MNRQLNRLRLGLRHPGLVVRRLRGEDINRRADEISLDEIAAFLPEDPIILEAGALDGTDTVRMARRWPSAQIHAFEPVPAAFELLASGTAAIPGVSIYETALSDRTATALLHLSADEEGRYRPDSSSLLEPTAHLDLHPQVTFPSEIAVATITLSDWARATGVERVDFMWLDLQGMELAVLASSPEFTQRSWAICTEVVLTELYAGCPLYPEVRDKLRLLGFRPVIERIDEHSGNVLFVSEAALARGGGGSGRRRRGRTA